MQPYFQEYGSVVFTPPARQPAHTHLQQQGPTTWQVSQTICDPQADNSWALHGRIVLGAGADLAPPLLQLDRIGI